MMNKAEVLAMLNGYSHHQLVAIGKAAHEMAQQLRQDAPSYDLAIAAGVVDCSYNTNNYGLIPSYSGEAVVTMSNGQKWRCVGHRSKGCPVAVSRNGYIEFFKLK